MPTSCEKAICATICRYVGATGVGAVLIYPLCDEKDCENRALSGENRCLEHSVDQQRRGQDLRRTVESAPEIRFGTFDRLEISDLDLSGRLICCSSFSNAIFTNVKFTKSKFRLCIFDFATFVDCNFENSDMKYSVFAGARLTRADFGNSDILHCNFNGAEATDVAFNDSDLYYSSFVAARLLRVGFVDCNLKKVRFEHSARDEVSFKYSNHEEALFSEEST